MSIIVNIGQKARRIGELVEQALNAIEKKLSKGILLSVSETIVEGVLSCLQN